jgi:gliding motility-associated protein GldM
MAGSKETPRQKMIAMMYLVMTALLALNVSKDVIDAFAVVNESVLQTNATLSQKLEDTYLNFELSYHFNPGKVKPFWDKAKIASELTQEMVNYIDSIRNKVISLTEGIPIDSAKIISINDFIKKDNNTIPTNFFLGSSTDGSEGVARELKERINKFNENMDALIDPKFKDHVKFSLSTEGPYYNADGLEENWEMHFFYNTILVADVTILNKIIIDVLNAEFDVVNLLHKSIGQGDFKFDRIEAKILPKSKFVFLGEDYTAEIIVAAYDTSQSPYVYFQFGIDSLPVSQIDKSDSIKVRPDKPTLIFPSTYAGQKKYAGFVRVKSALDVINDYHFKGEFTVVRPLSSISATNMNVLYIGVDNPVSVAVSGVLKEFIHPFISCGTITPKPMSNEWIVNVTPECREATISITAIINDVNKPMGSQKFRVKKLPDPTATIANKYKGTINRDIMIAAGVIIPRMPDDFEFDHTFVIKSFTLTVQRGFKIYNFQSENDELTEEMILQLKQTNRGQNIVFEDIVAVNPFGDERILSPIILRIE